MSTNSTEKVLGRGYSGIVFKGEWNNKIVAVKRIQIENVENNKGGEEALQILDHSNVVKLYHFESDLDFRYYALEFCQASLDQKFLDETNPKKYCGPMPPDEEVCLQLAKGLAHIHEKGLIHRDLKPHNVLIWVDSTGEQVVMKWADFGLSKTVNPGGSHSISGVRGTRNWFSPEILKIMMEGNDGKTTSPDIRPRGTVKSDVFTAGLVFGYYLLDGHHPFGSGYDIEQNVVNNEPVNLTKMREQHPMHSTIITEMLKDNPDERISSADVVSRINNFIEFQSRILRSVQSTFAYNRWGLGNKIPIFKAEGLSAVNANLGTVSTENDFNWNEIIAPAPMGIAVMSQLLICSSRVRDFKIGKIDTTHIPLMKHPDSFRKTLVQITDECYDAFMKAHINMEIIQLKMEKVPDYIKDCIKSMQSENQSDKQNLLMPKRLDRIKEVATDGEVLSKEVCDTFDKLGQLIRQVITASVKTMGDHEIADTIGEKKSKREIKKANETVREKQNYLDGIRERERKWVFWLPLIGGESKHESLEHGRKMKEEAENKLKELKVEKEVCEKEINQMLKENIEMLDKMGIDVNDGVSTKQAIETLKEGLKHLTDLQKQWAGITLYFNKIKNHLTETTAKNLEDFIDNADVAQEGSEEYELVMPASIKDSLQSSPKTHHSVKMLKAPTITS